MEQLSSKVVYRNAWMTVREDDVRLPDGRTTIYGVIDKPDCALVVPREHGGFWLVEQFRYAIGRRTLEFPQGSWGEGSDGSADELALAELREETGLAAQTLRHLGRMSLAHGFCSQFMNVYLAEGLTHGAPDREQSEQDMTQRWVSEDEFVELVRTGEVVDSASIAAWGLLRLA